MRIKMICSKKNTIIFIILTLIFFFGKIKADNKYNGIGADSSGFVEINNVQLYYEIVGNGVPLFYLHGGLSSSKDFSKYVSEFSSDFKVITVDRKGHGRSYDDHEPYSYSSMAESMNLFLEYLGIDSVLVIGWSDGGVVGFHLASKYPSKVKKLIAVSANYLVDGMTKSSIEWIKTQLTPVNISKVIPSIENEYKNINPNPNNFANFINKTRDMWLSDPYISKEDFVKIKVPVLLVAGDKDDIRLEHMIEMQSLLTNSQLCILPNTTHFVFAESSEIVTKILIEFLKNKVNK
jgi:pimeloyl-ACP methyl ester carboxylesterase